MSNIRQNLITLILILMVSIVPNLAKTNYHKNMCDGFEKIKGGHVAKRRNFDFTYLHISFTKCVFAFLCLKSFLYFSFDFLSKILAIFQNSFILTVLAKKRIFQRDKIKTNYFKKQNFCHHIYLPALNIQVCFYSAG